MKAIQNLIRQREKMLWRIRNKVTPDIVNAEFRAALARYKERNPQEAKRKFRDRTL